MRSDDRPALSPTIEWPPHSSGDLFSSMKPHLHDILRPHGAESRDWRLVDICDGAGLRLDFLPSIGSGYSELFDVGPDVIVAILDFSLLRPLLSSYWYFGTLSLLSIIEGSGDITFGNYGSFRIGDQDSVNYRSGAKTYSYINFRPGRFAAAGIIARNRAALINFPFDFARASPAQDELISAPLDETVAYRLQRSKPVLEVARQMIQCRYHGYLRHRFMVGKASEFLCAIAAAPIEASNLEALARPRVADASDVASTIRLILEQELDQPLSLEDIARRAGFSERKCLRDFKAIFGISIQAYRQERRLEQAKRLLAEPGRSVTEIALDVGYASPSALTRAFVKAYGCVPSQLRRSHETEL